MSSLSNAAPSSHQSRTAEVNIPTPASSCGAGTGSSTEASLYDISQLDETDVFGSSRASSVTVISEHDRNSMLSPFASPVNGDTPVISIRSHPFGIRTTPISLMSPSDYRKGSQSESDSLDSLNVRGQQEVAGSNASLHPYKKAGVAGNSGDLLTSQGLHTPLRKNSPLLSSARQTGFSKTPPEASDNRQEANHCNCHYGNPTTCATLACCESMGMCPIQDGFLTFDPTKNSRTTSLASSHLAHQHGYEADDEYSISHLATRGMLGPAHSLDSNSSLVSPSSLDSGYDQSWSLTNSSRNSCAEFSLSAVCSNKNHPPPGGVVEVPAAKCLCNENDSGRGSQCSCPKDKSCRRALQFADSVVSEGLAKQGAGGGKSSPARSWQRHPEDPGSNSTTTACSGVPAGIAGTAVSQEERTALTDSDATCSVLPGKTERGTALVDPDPASGAFPVRLSSRHGKASQGVATSPPSSESAGEKQLGPASSDPTSSVFPVKLSRYGQGLSLSALSPESGEEKELEHCDDPSLEVFAVSSDPLAPVPVRRIKNHIRTISQAKELRNKELRNNVNVSSSDHMSAENSASVLCTPNSDLCADDDDFLESALSSISLPSALDDSTSVPASIPPRADTFGSTFSTSSVPVSCGPTSSSLLCSAPTSSLTSCHPTPHMVVEDTPPSATGSICSEVDSGRGTKSSIKTGDFDTRSLSQISEISYECEPEASLSTLALLRHRTDLRANSSPPLFDNQPRLGCGEEESCSLGGACRSFPSLFKHLGTEGEGDASNRQAHVNPEGVAQTGRLGSTRSLSEPPSMLQQQLHRHEQSLIMGFRPSTLQQFDNFTDVPLPDLEDFHLDMPSPGSHQDEQAATHRHQMSDFGHSLFVG